MKDFKNVMYCAAVKFFVFLCVKALRLRLSGAGVVLQKYDSRSRQPNPESFHAREKRKISPPRSIAPIFALLIFSAAQATAELNGPREILIRASNSDSLDPHVLLEVIEGQLNALRTGNILKAYTDFTSSDFKKITSQQQFKLFVKNFSVLSANRSVKFNSVNFEKSIATFEATLISQNGDTLDAEYDLTLEDGKWKILGIQLFNPEITDLRPQAI